MWARRALNGPKRRFPARAVGHGNAYYVGHYDGARKAFVPLGATPAPPPPPPAAPAPAGALLGAWALANASGASSHRRSSHYVAFLI